jgi:RNA polymerase sigma factor (TIGR02999 family)
MEPGEITRLLHEMAKGDRMAEEQLIPLVYNQLHHLAAALMRDEPPDHILQTTALVHEAYLRLVGGAAVDWSDRAHFFAGAATVMRRILVDHARSRRSEKRGGEIPRVNLDEVKLGSEESWDQILAVHEALSRFAAVDQRASKVVELRFFAGLGLEEVAQLLSVSTRTVKRDWEAAQAWLYAEMAGSA